MTGFTSVILYTALPEGLEGHNNIFVRLVGKEAGSLPKLKAEIDDLFRLHIPQLNRALITHLDRALCSYMWKFVQVNWKEFAPIIQKPEFVRLLVQRLAMTLSREGIESMTCEIFGGEPPATDIGEKVHPAEFYIKPTIGTDLSLGDIWCRQSETSPEYGLILWPSCDLVGTGGRSPKIDKILSVKADLLESAREMIEWNESQTQKKEDLLIDLMKNTRNTNYGFPDRYHYLPGVWDIPDLVVDFQKLELIPLTEICSYKRLATLASPFAESLYSRFLRYLGRLGTPDLNIDAVIEQMKRRTTPPHSETKVE
jgi:hypothetical protein